MAQGESQFRRVGGIVGPAASGKDTVARVFAEHGFAHVSGSDLVREEIASRGLQTSRSLQTEVANELRRTHGAGYWVELSLGRAGTRSDVIVSGIYSPGEGTHIQQYYGGFVVAVVVGSGDDSHLRFDRLQARADGNRDRLSYEEFMAAHARENSGVTPEETNILALQRLADFIVLNTGDLALLEEQTLTIIEDLGGSGL